MEFDVAERDPGQHLAGGVVAQRLLDPVTDASGIGPDLGLLAGLRSAQYQAWASSLVVVSLPATTIRNRKLVISSSVRRSPSISAAHSAETRSSPG